MGLPTLYGSIEKIREVIRELVPVDSQMGKGGDPSWIIETSHLALFHQDEEGGLIPFSPTPPPEKQPPDEDYPLKAILGSVMVPRNRSLCHLPEVFAQAHSWSVCSSGF